MFIPAVKEAESRLRCTSDVNYRESIADNNSLPLLSDRPQHFLQTGHPHFRRLCHLCSGAQAGAAGGHKIMAAITLQDQRDILIFPVGEAYNCEQLKKSAELWPLPRLW